MLKICISEYVWKWEQVRFIFLQKGLLKGFIAQRGEQPWAAPYQDCSQTAINYCSHIKKTDKDHKLGLKVF